MGQDMITFGGTRRRQGLGLALCLAAVTAAALGAGAMAEDKPSIEDAWQAYHDVCAGCHDVADNVGGMTVPVIRTIGPPRVRHVLSDGNDSLHAYMRYMGQDRLALVMDYLDPEADTAMDCGPPGFVETPVSPQCLELKASRTAQAR